MSSKQKPISKTNTLKNFGKKASVPSKAKRSSKKNLTEDYADGTVKVSKLKFYQSIYYTLQTRNVGHEIYYDLQVITDPNWQFVPLAFGKSPFVTMNITSPIDSHRTIHPLDLANQYIYLVSELGSDTIKFYDVGSQDYFMSGKSVYVDNGWNYRITTAAFEAAFSAQYDGEVDKSGVPNLIFSNQQGLITEYETNPSPGFVARHPQPKKALRSK